MSSASTAGAALYDQEYARRYRAMYIEPWGAKHRLNEANLRRLLETELPPAPRWLDLACGQAWHFSRFPGRATQVGVDASAAQLFHARQACPEAELVLSDMTQVRLPRGSFDLVTSFWGAYCYLASRERIAEWLENAVAWVREGGALYLEVLLAEDLASFNRSHFSEKTGFKVAALGADYEEWSYSDVGGCHRMTSPPLRFFLDIVEPEFARVEAHHDRGFMVHLIASGKRARP